MSGPRKEMVNKMNVIFATHLKLTLQWEIQPKKNSKQILYRVPYKGEENKSTIKQKK